MNNERIVSIGTNSMIYHKPGCRYVARIKNQNKMILSKHNAKKEGYHVCRYCNSMNHHFQVEQQTLEFYSRCKNMQFNYINGILSSDFEEVLIKFCKIFNILSNLL